MNPYSDSVPEGCKVPEMPASTSDGAERVLVLSIPTNSHIIESEILGYKGRENCSY